MITAHVHKMLDMINITYPEVLARIRTYNDTEQHNNIFNGGFVNATQRDVYAMKNNMLVSNPIISKSDSKSKTLSMSEFNHIFNPQNLDIPQLLNAYLRTLNLGQQTINQGIKSIKGKKGGKRQKRSSQNRKRKTKRRVYRSKKSYRRHR
jgi:hypothetical protein